MLVTLPELLFLEPLSAFLIRVALGLTIGYGAWLHLRGETATIRILAAAEAAIAMALFLGSWTQITAIAAAVVVARWLVSPATRPLPRSTSLLALVMCLSLLVTGAGALAFDLPL